MNNSSTLVPQTETIGYTEKLLKNIRKMSVARQLIPMEASTGWSIPLRQEGKVYLIVPFFSTNRNSEGQIALFPPFATITVDWTNQVPVEYVDLRFKNPAPELIWTEPVGTFPHARVSRMKVKEYEQKRRELLSMYDEMLSTLVEGNSFSQQWIERFQELLSLLLEPDLEPYYRALAPKFFARFLGNF
ncbi:hypothetical protein Sta7437_4485 [Stanieria cyanosphaera PCC 7437]|uniref:Uncharacterized protein n=1 Tax=Stanieria cyanosphaera (strain ATCC 29371 / PCC 7437) TaxID=111780 RepID=K9Y0V6_STAC7|nr:hypothetical protein [Stanieria cyanosphaera]AFZ37949.1 hypothetical protein Sta7437_4485 [Stanieria cyanosphaera PCC 7437]